jgi:putative hydrolase of the HAD superfamily
MSLPIDQRPDWAAIDTVLLDLDGTLLDQAYDNHIWHDLIPERFAAVRGMALPDAHAEIARLFAGRSGTLHWYDIAYWSRTLGIDVGELHREVRAQVAWLPGAREFLQRVRAMSKRLVLLTNSHPVALAVKHAQTGVLDHLDAAASSQEFGAPKEQAAFWTRAQARFGFDPARSLFADDHTRCWPPRATPGFAGSTACGTGTASARSVTMRMCRRSKECWICWQLREVSPGTRIRS